MSHIYRTGMLGTSLADSLDAMVDAQKISPQLATAVMQKFDEAFARAMETKVSAKANFKSKLQVYRYIDNVWQFVMSDTSIRLAPFLSSSKKDEELLLVEGPLKMVLVDAKLLVAEEEEAGGAGGKQ